MGFLTPLFLALAAGIAVPLILHLYHRQQGPRVIFPALRYLRRAEKESARRIRLRQIFLLALRISAVVLLALAAARPFLRAGGAGHEPTAAAIVLDNSMSTGLVQQDRRVLDTLKRRALELLARAGPDDRFWVIRAGSPWEPAIPGDAVAAANRIRATEVSAGRADLAASLGRARALLAGGAEGRATEIELLSDLQQTGLPAPVQARRGDAPVVAWLPGTAVPANGGVVDVQVGGGLPPRAGERSTLAAATGGTRADSVSVRLNLEGRIVAADNVPVGATAILPVPARPAGLVWGSAEIDPDALRGDDRRFFVSRVQPPPAVALTRPLPFVDAALGVLADAGRIRRGGPGDADVVIAPAAVGIEGTGAGRTAVVLPPESPLELPAANRRLEAAGVPWRFGTPTAGGESRFALPDSTDALARALSQIRARQIFPVQREGAAAGDTVLVRLSDGSPWAVRGTLPSGGRYILVASPLSQEATTLPTSSAMLPFLDHITGPWAAAQATREEFEPGDRVLLPAGADAVQRPDGGTEKVEGGEYVAPGDAGIYRVRAGNQEVRAFAVNAPAAESDLERLSGRRLRAALPGWDVETADDPAEWTRDIFRHRFGHETWRPLVLLLLAVLLVEGLVATAGRGRTPAEAAARRRGDGAAGAPEPAPARTSMAARPADAAAGRGPGPARAPGPGGRR
ncbi:MAG TPA: BatA and WFA domain-containing protein [Longimicrobiales bacterium]|nr:BatA and WFA domain-containing protein [Longimicrobiales bacterium]